MPLRRIERYRTWCLVALLLALVSPAAASGLLDPLLRFRQMRTAHFVIYFHQGEEPLASRLASFVEAARDQVGAALGVEPPALTHVILADQSEQANGWATPLPRNTIFLHAAAPSGADFIGRTGDWLRLVFTHEYTHIVHLDRSGGWARIVRGMLGRNGIAFPNMWLPQWQIEGVATFEENAITGGGRRDAGDFRAVERLAAGSARRLTLDRASGGLVGWPDGHAAYAAGLGFHEYLADRFGEASLGRLATATSRRLPFLGTRAFRGVYGQSLGSLWRDYTAQLEAAPPGAGSNPHSPVHQLTRRGHVIVAPRFAPSTCETCPEEIVYTSQGPGGFPSLRSVSADGTGDRRLASRYLGATTGVSDDLLVFDQLEVRRNVALLSDLFAMNRRTGAVHPLTRGARLQDPDLSPDGRRLAAVREGRGIRELVVAGLTGAYGGNAEIEMLPVDVVASEPDTQYGAPRWSPDGRLLAVERRRLGALPEVVLVDPDNRQILTTWGDASARIVTPAWRPDGQALVAAADFDGDGFDLYELLLNDPDTARRLTRTDGAIWPDVSADGRSIVFAGYSASGYDVHTAPYAWVPGAAPRVLTRADVPQPAAALAAPADATPYSPLSTLAPTTWTPFLIADADQTRLGAAVGGADILARHAYAISASWMVNGPRVPRPQDGARPDWAASYAYTRWRPAFFGNLSRQALFRTVAGRTPSEVSQVSGSEREVQAGVYVPLVRVRSTAQLLASVVGTETRLRLPQGDRSNRVISSRVGFAYDTSQRYGYSISRERGVFAGTTLELSRRALGARADATTATVDARAYLPGAGAHHVVALRAAAGYSRGSDLARQTFTLGRFAASPSVIDFGSGALGLLRGGLSHTIAGDRLMVGNVEYRLPLAVLERGRGTLPLFLRTAHASIFADVAHLRGGPGSPSWTRALGAELSLDAVAGYGLPFAATVGVSWGRDGAHAGRAQVYARLGRAF